jgi:hypothetical protein
VSKKIDLTGQRFERLVVTKEAGTNRWGSALWECLCDCGTSKVIIATCGGLRSGQPKSCGCYTLERIRECSKGPPPKPAGVAHCNRCFAHCKKGSKDRNLEFSLTKEQFIDISEQPCHYCGKEPSVSRGALNRQKQIGHRHNGLWARNGIDRKDNDIGYVFENCLPCCAICNHAKHTLSYQEFTDWLRQASRFVLQQQEAA